MRRGSYFFVIDAFIASIIIVLGLILMFSRYIDKPVSTQTFYTGEDFLSTAETTQIINFDKELVRGWTANTTIIDNSHRTLLEQMVLFEIKSCVKNLSAEPGIPSYCPPPPGIAYDEAIENRRRLDNLSRLMCGSVPDNVNIQISIQGTEVNPYNVNELSQRDILDCTTHRNQIDINTAEHDANVMFVGRRIVAARKLHSNEIYEPVVVEVQTWQ